MIISYIPGFNSGFSEAVVWLRDMGIPLLIPGRIGMSGCCLSHLVGGWLGCDASSWVPALVLCGVGVILSEFRGAVLSVNGGMNRRGPSHCRQCCVLYSVLFTMAWHVT